LQPRRHQFLQAVEAGLPANAVFAEGIGLIGLSAKRKLTFCTFVFFTLARRAKILAFE